MKEKKKNNLTVLTYVMDCHKPHVESTGKAKICHPKNNGFLRKFTSFYEIKQKKKYHAKTVRASIKMLGKLEI